MSDTLKRKKLPIGIQTFAEIRQEGCYYVDKTPFALQLIAEGKYYFLSRPRRFGKSLLIDTLKCLFEGQRALFEGLYAASRWDWSVTYPVIRLSSSETDMAFRLRQLIRALHQQCGQRVVVLVDEYDKPILDNLNDPELARAQRDALRNLYSVIKDSDAHVKFALITGVSKFSKVSLFSGLNNLNDITLDPAYSALCGYTDPDLDTVFAPELPGLDRQQLRDWYNGYNWGGEAVYNPFDMLLLFQKRVFRPYWFETGTPSFLVNFLAERQWFTPDLNQLQTNATLLSSFDVDSMSPEALLWQAGYLTFRQIQELAPGHWFYTLGYPNREVEFALNDALLPAYGPTSQAIVQSRPQLIQALQHHDTDQLRASITALFASIPHDWYRKSPLAGFEGHYASVFYSQLAALGLDVRGEDVTNQGRIDLSLKLGAQVYLFEFKVVADQPEGKALQQLIIRDYAAKYRAPGVRITLIGAEFSRRHKNLVGWEVLADKH